jgi:hypothetical protein
MEQLRELIAEREASIAALQAELEALRLAASLLSKREASGSSAVNNINNKDTSSGNGAISAPRSIASKGQFV